MSEYRSALREDYNLTLQMKKDSLLCYSPKKMKETSGNVIGEVLLKVPKPPKQKASEEGAAAEKETPSEEASTGSFLFGSHRLHTRPVGYHKSLLYKKAGYVWVGGEDYLCVLTDRRPFLAALGAMTAVFGVALAVLLTLGPASIPPEHPMPDRDENSIPVVGDEDSGTGGGRVESEVGGGFVSMIFTKEAEVDLSDAKIDMYFVNPQQSNHSVAIELYVTFMDRHWLVASSGRVDADYGIRAMTFNEKVSLTPTTEQRIYKGKYVVRYYNPDSGERSVFTTEITDVIITVVE